MQNDFRLLTPTTITLDALAITAVMIRFQPEHEIVVTIRDNQDRYASVSVRNGASQGLGYNAGVWTGTSMETLTGFDDAVSAMLTSALPGLAAYLLATGLLVVEGGAEAIVPAP